MAVHFAEYEDLEQVNVLRKQVNDLHVEGRPETFKPGFSEALCQYLYEIYRDPDIKIVVAERDGAVCGFAVLHHIIRPETPYMHERDYLDIDEFCVDETRRRRGIGGEMIRFIRNYAKNTGYDRVELNMWEFNRDALAFYEAVGFSTYRRYMEMRL